MIGLEVPENQKTNAHVINGDGHQTIRDHLYATAYAALYVTGSF